MKLGEIFDIALRTQGLTNAEWESVMTLLDDCDDIGNKIRNENPVLFGALNCMMKNQAIIETQSAFYPYVYDRLKDEPSARNRELSGHSIGDIA